MMHNMPRIDDGRRSLIGYCIGKFRGGNGAIGLDGVEEQTTVGFEIHDGDSAA